MAKKKSNQQYKDKKPTMIERLRKEFGIKKETSEKYWEELLKKERD